MFSGGGGGRLGGPGGPGSNNNRFNLIPYDRPAIGGGIDRHGCPWRGGSLDPSAHGYHSQANAKPHTVCCLRTDDMETKNHKTISSGVKNCPKLATKSNLLTSKKLIWTGVVDNGFD